MRIYKVCFKSKVWRHLSVDWLVEEFKTRELAQSKRLELQNLGYVRVAVRLVKGERRLSDF